MLLVSIYSEDWSWAVMGQNFFSNQVPQSFRRMAESWVFQIHLNSFGLLPAFADHVSEDVALRNEKPDRLLARMKYFVWILCLRTFFSYFLAFWMWVPWTVVAAVSSQNAESWEISSHAWQSYWSSLMGNALAIKDENSQFIHYYKDPSSLKLRSLWKLWNFTSTFVWQEPNRKLMASHVQDNSTLVDAPGLSLTREKSSKSPAAPSQLWFSA